MKQKIMVTLPPLDVYFLPHFSDFLKLTIGESGSFPSLVEAMAEAAQIKAPHRQTLRKAEEEPVTPGVARKIQRVWHSSLADTQSLQKLEALAEPWRTHQFKNNGISWISGLAGIAQSPIGRAVEKSRSARFIRKRVEQEKSFLEWFHREYEASSGKPQEPGLWVRQAQEFLIKNTCVGPELIFSLSQIDPTASDPESDTWRRGLGVLKLVNHQLRVDFYYTLLCELALDVASYLAQHGAYEPHKKQMVESGFVGDIAPLSTLKRGAKDTPLIRLLEVWKLRLSELNGRTFSWREMASYLPSPSGSEDEFQSYRSETPREYKYRWLKKWRAGEVPDRSKLESFIARLCEGQESDHYLAWVKAQVALAWGQLIKEEESMLASLVAEYPDFCRFNALGTYGKYWHQYRDQAADISAV